MQTPCKSESQPVPEPADKQNNRSISAEIWHSAKDLISTTLYTGIAEPVLGVTQIGDKAAGLKNADSVSNGFAAIGISAPEKPSGMLDHHAQMLGSAIGMVLPYLLLHKGVRTGAARVFGEETFASRSALSLGSKEFGSVMAKEAGLAFTTGFTYDAVFRPSANSSNSFVTDRLLNGVAGGATMATLTASSFGLNRLGASEAISAPWAKTLLANPMSAGVFSAVPAGLVSAEASALRSGNLLPTLSDAGQSIYQMGLVGLTLGGAHYLGAPREGTKGSNFDYLIKDRIKNRFSSTSESSPTVVPNDAASSASESRGVTDDAHIAQPRAVETFKTAEISQIESPKERAERLKLPLDMEASKDLFFGKVQNTDGSHTDVVIRPFSQGPNAMMRIFRAEVSGNVNETIKASTGVDSPTLPLVLRDNVELPGATGTVMIQENGGKQLGTQLREWTKQAYGPADGSEVPAGSITKLINENPEVRELMGRAAFDNMFKGNVDLVEFSQQTIKEGTAGTALVPSGKHTLAAVDNKNDFTLLEKPSWGFGSQFGLSLEVAKALEGKKLSQVSPKLQSDAQAMLKVFSTEEGKAKLLSDGLSVLEIEAARSRLQILTIEGFPKHLGEMNFYGDDAQTQLTASLNGDYDTEGGAVREYLKSRDENLVIDTAAGNSRVKPGTISDLTTMNVKNPKTGEVIETTVEHSTSDKGMPELTLKDSNGNKIGYLRYELVDPKPGEKSMNFMYGYPDRTPQSFLWIDMMRVEPEFQGQGMRQALVAQLVKESKRLGFDGRVKLQAANEFGSVSAIPWYKAGFRAQAGSTHQGERVEQARQLLADVAQSKRHVDPEEGERLNNLLMYLPTDGN